MVDSAAVQEKQPLEYEINDLAFALPEVLIVSEMLSEQATRQKAADFIGAAITGAAAEVIPVQSPIESLYEAVQLAAKGDASAKALINMNAKTDVIERTIKTGHVMEPIPLTVTDEGSFIQHGQTTESIQANSLRFAANHPIMRKRTEAEIRNMFRIKELYEKGFFDDYMMVVISRAEDLPEAGFFTDTMSCCIQVTSEKNGGLVIESAFVAGIAEAETEAHDEATVIRLGKFLDPNIDFTDKTPAEIIDMPLLVRKDKLPHGAIDVVRLYDVCAGNTFFGEAKPQQDYLVYLEKCHEREKRFLPKVEEIVTELIAEAPIITGPVMAIERLHKISGKHMVEQAVLDHSIDARVFGVVAAPMILQARIAAQDGDWIAMDRHIEKAKATETSNSCPGGIKKNVGLDGDSTATSESREDTDKECDFISKECPMCKKKNVKTTVTKTHISGDCGCSVRRSQKVK